MTVAAWFGFVVAAAVGATARFGIDDAVRRRQGPDSPWGILAVNVVGCLCLGVVVGLGLHHGLDTDVATVVGTGGFGAFTTFSTFTVETVRLAQSGETGRAIGLLAATIGLGLTAAAVGVGITAVW